MYLQHIVYVFATYTLCICHPREANNFLNCIFYIHLSRDLGKPTNLCLKRKNIWVPRAGDCAENWLSGFWELRLGNLFTEKIDYFVCWNSTKAGVCVQKIESRYLGGGKSPCGHAEYGTGLFGYGFMYLQHIIYVFATCNLCICNI